MGDLSSPCVVFEDSWRRLRQSDHDGWGGARLEDRLNGWRRDLKQPLLQEQFSAPAKDVLEIGCGAGHVSSIIAAKGHRVTGIDFSPTAVAWARERWGTSSLDVRFLELRAESVASLGPARFDLVIDGNCLHCLGHDIRSSALSGIASVLRDDGLAVFSSMVLGTEMQFKDYIYAPEEKRLYLGEQAWRHLVPAEELLLELDAAGLVPALIDKRKRSAWDHLFVIARKRK
jgi:2-polyprenyl-3-methyl-5-hydroxy-6-metoxy-1,4-benzoquinol methylase